MLSLRRVMGTMSVRDSSATMESRPGTSSGTGNQHPEAARVRGPPPLPDAIKVGYSSDDEDDDEGCDAYDDLVGRNTKCSEMRSETGVHVRVVGQQVADYMHVPVPHTAMRAGADLTLRNIRTNKKVVRGPAWDHGHEDGGADQPGTVVSWNKEAMTATVQWTMSGLRFDHYRLGPAADLCEARSGGSMVGNATAFMKSLMGKTRPQPLKLTVTSAALDAAVSSTSTDFALLGSPNRKNSQLSFAESHQTCIIFDWDDTLF